MWAILSDTTRSSFTDSKGLTRADFPTAALSGSRTGVLEDSAGRPAGYKPVNAGNRPGQVWRYLPGLFQSNFPRTRFLHLKGVGKAKSEMQSRSGGSGLAPNGTPRGKPTSGTHQRPAYGSELPITYSRSETTSRRKSTTRNTLPANESHKLGKLARTNQELETSLPKKWEAIIGNDGQISDVLRGEYLPSVSSFHEYEPAIWLQNMVVDDAATPNFLFLGKKGSAVKEFLPFLSKTYLHHLGIDLKNGKLSRKTDKMGILCNKFRNRVIGSKRSSRKGSDDYGTPTTYDVLMNDLIKSVIEVNESLYLDEFSKETDFEQKSRVIWAMRKSILRWQSLVALIHLSVLNLTFCYEG
ncbi:hypothetical protein PCASD_02089 [Puccinia coronata f. sp. avenae]|uniref:Uncharacterized protein n=1 Tax=Puccinia coronata f. sp. avenae TaxID=200324 RepID=A0A2N5VQ04_9BASI|nr:hypothetical protein PCASD_02089 [Puccinia coronata f. sp. avenae]